MKRRVQEMPQYSQPSMAMSSLLYSALGSPRDLSGRSKTFSQGLFWLPRRLSFLFTEQRCWGGRGSPFLLLAGVSLLFPLSPELHSAQFFSSPTPPPHPSIPPPAPDEQDPNSGLSLEIILQLHWQKTSVFDNISSRDKDLAGRQVLSWGGGGISFPREDYRADLCWKCWLCYVLLYPHGDYGSLLTNLLLRLLCWEHPGIHGAPALMICWGRGSRSTMCSHHHPLCDR